MKLPSIEPRDRDRFLAAVAEHVPLDRVVELYLFQPIRQGGVESGVAVIAASPDLPAAGGPPHSPDLPPGEVAAAVATCEPTGAEALIPEPQAPQPDAARSDASEAQVPLPSASDAVESDADAATHGAPVDDPAQPGRAEPRYTVFTAHYRHVLKGPERGRWEVSVVAEAEAPLAAVGAVVRGVQRRAGDVDPPEHMTGDALRDVVGQTRPGAGRQ